MSAYFYTGRTPMDVIFSNPTGLSSYAEYQQYFKENIASTSVIQRLPGIVAMAALKTLLLLSIYRWYSDASSVKDLLLLISCSLSYMYFSSARGTNFELFELAVFLFAGAALYKPHWFRLRAVTKWLGALIFVSIALTVFVSRVTARADLICYTRQICYLGDVGDLSVSSSLSYLFFLLSGYFSYGLYFLGSSLAEVYSDNVLSFLFGGTWGIGNHADLVCDVAIDCGVNWESYLSVVLANVGYLPMLGIGFLAGYLLRRLMMSLVRRPALSKFLLYSIMIAVVVSFFFGNFLVGSSNIIVMLVALSLSWWSKMGGHDNIVKSQVNREGKLSRF